MINAVTAGDLNGRKTRAIARLPSEFRFAVLAIEPMNYYTRA